MCIRDRGHGVLCHCHAWAGHEGHGCQDEGEAADQRRGRADDCSPSWCCRHCGHSAAEEEQGQHGDTVCHAERYDPPWRPEKHDERVGKELPDQGDCQPGSSASPGSDETRTPRVDLPPSQVECVLSAQLVREEREIALRVLRVPMPGGVLPSGALIESGDQRVQQVPFEGCGGGKAAEVGQFREVTVTGCVDGTDQGRHQRAGQDVRDRCLRDRVEASGQSVPGVAALRDSAQP